MKKVLIDPKLNSYKANLHCHTTISDGVKTPEEIKELYKKNGYNIVAYTDHEYLVDQSHLNDENFLALNGYEISICEQSDPFVFDYLKCYHFNFIAKNNKINVLLVFESKRETVWENFVLCVPRPWYSSC